MEAHEGIRMPVVELALNGLPVHILGDRIVDIEKSHLLLADAKTDILGQGSVNVHFAGDGNSLPHKSAVDIAGDEAKHILKGRPALGG